MASSDESGRIERLRKDLGPIIAKYQDQLTPAQVDILLRFCARSISIGNVPSSQPVFLEAHHLLALNHDDPAGWLLFDVGENWAGTVGDLYRMYHEE